MTKRLRNIFVQYSQAESHLTNSLLLVFNHNRDLMQKVLKQHSIKLSGKQVKVEGCRVRRDLITLGRLTGAGKRSQQGIRDIFIGFQEHLYVPV